MQDSVVRHATLRAQWGRESPYPVKVIPHCRGESRPQLREGGPEVAGEASLLGADWRGGLPEDPVWAACRNGVGYSSPVDFGQRLPVGVLRGGSVLQMGLN